MFQTGGGVLAAALLGVAASMPVWSGAGAAPNPKYAAIVMDAHTGKVLHARNADSRRSPASLTKIMTLYIMFEQFESGRMTFATPIRVSRRAAGQAPSRLGLRPGRAISGRDALSALVTKSANDVATAVAEHIAGTETGFVRIMNTRAHVFGMAHTRFRNASGLPDRRQYTTARDMALLSQRLMRDFPQYYSYFKMPSFAWNGRTYVNHNHLLKRYRGADGIKTGYTRASGFNLASSATRGGKRLIAVVMGGRSIKERDARTMDLLRQNWGRAQTLQSVRLSPEAIPRLNPWRAAAWAQVSAPPSSTALQSAQAPRTAQALQSAQAPQSVQALQTAQAPQSAPVPLAPARISGPGPDAPRRWIIPLAEIEQGSAAARDTPGGSPAPLQGATWSIHVGVFSSQDAAARHLLHMADQSPQALGGLVLVIATGPHPGDTAYHARFLGFTGEAHARNTCRALAKLQPDCAPAKGFQTSVSAG